MIHAFVVTELSVFRLLLSAALGRKILIVEVEPLLPHTVELLERIVRAVVRTGRARWAIEGMETLKRVKNVPGRTLLYDVFGRIEPWQDDYFGFANLENAVGNDAMAVKLAVTNYFTQKHVSLLVLNELLAAETIGKFVLIGAPADTFAAAGRFCGKPAPGSAAWIPARLVNIGLTVAVALASLRWIAAHARPGKPDAKPFFLAADFIGDDRDVRLYRELEDGGPMLMVKRGVGKTSPLLAELGGYTVCDLEDGRVSFRNAASAFVAVLRDAWRIYRRFAAVHPALFWRLVKLPYRRLLYRGLFARYRPKFFWGRDPYNEDHVIRRQELNKTGGRSFGVNTGYLTWSILIPAWRYVSFDRFYVFGRGRYDKYYGATWAKDMAVVPAGSFTADRAHYANRFAPRQSDIAVFASVFIGEPEMTALVRALAAAFPDRMVILQVKSNFLGVPGTEAFIAGCREGLANVEYTTDPVYDIFFRARYGFSDPSSVVVEAMQFGMISFAFDLPHVQATNVNREYPGLCVTTAEDAIARICAIEAGTWRYPVESFQDAVDLSGTVFFDRVRGDMGLPPRAENIPLYEGIKESTF
jgi:hypothetical protein